MAAVIGSNLYNRDPNKMAKGLQRDSHIGILNGSGSVNNSGVSGFWANGVWTASLTSAQVGNTYRTITDISSKKGFLTHAIGADTGAGPAYFKITVDGVVTVISFPAMTPNLQQRAIIGWLVNTVSGSYHDVMQGTTGTTTWTANDNIILYNTGGPLIRCIADTNITVAQQTLGCVRFENSLKVEYKQLFAVSAGIDSYTGVMYKLDA